MHPQVFNRVWLVRLVFALLVSGAAVTRAGPLEKPNDYVIHNDGGGIVGQYVAKYKALQEHGVHVVIDGWCASSCTIALALPGTCVTKRAMLGFHRAYYANLFGYHVDDPTDTAILWLSYPPQVRKWIMAHGGLTSSILIMHNSDARKLLPNCEGDGL